MLYLSIPSPSPPFVFQPLPPSLKHHTRNFSCKQTPHWVSLPLAVSRSLSLSVLDFTSRYPSSRRDARGGGGGAMAGGNHVSSSSHMNWDGAWHLLFAAACLNIIVVYDSHGAIVSGRLSLWSYVGKVQGTKSLHAAKISLRPSLEGGGDKPLIYGTSAARHLAL